MRQSSDIDLHQQVDSWLASWGFTGNPFSHWEAGRESLLDRYFVRPPFFEKLLRSHTSTFVFAPRGGGKSAMRIMLEAECRPAVVTSSVVAASFTDFSLYAESSLQVPQLTLASYVPLLIGSILPKLLIATAHGFVANQDYEEHCIGKLRYWLEEYDRTYLAYPRLLELVHSVEPSLSQDRLVHIAKRIQRRAPAVSKTSARVALLIEFFQILRQASIVMPVSPRISPSQEMAELVNLAIELLDGKPTACDALYLLVDGIDEYPLTQDNASASAAILQPIIGNVRLLELPGLAIKFFLPTEQRPALENAARLDRLEVVDLNWDATEGEESLNFLKELLRRRISAFNTSGLRSIDELCVPAMRHWVEDAILEEAHDSPRSVIRLGNFLFTEHCRHSSEANSLILPAEWERAISRYRATTKKMDDTKNFGINTERLLSDGLYDEPVNRLRVDHKSGKVYRGQELLPELPDLLFRLLAFLHMRKGQICTKDEIAIAVFEPKYDPTARQPIEGVSDQSISNLIYRLRKLIESPDDPKYIITIKGRGYRLDNAD